MTGHAADRVESVLRPRNVVIVGASERAGGWSGVVRENLRRFAFPGPVYAVNPRGGTVWGEPCYPDVDSLPEPPDHLAVMVPGAAVPDILAAACRAGARSATVFSGGFNDPADPDSVALRRRLAGVIAETGMAVSGPNCFGNVAAESRLVTVPDGRLQSIAPGPAAIVGQSGGVLTALQRRLDDRAIGWGYLITSGDELGLTTADYIAYLARDPAIRVILCFAEAVRDAPRFLAACREARAAGKPVVAIKIGGSEAGRAAALAHTGSLAGALEAFDAVTGAAGVIRVDTLTEMVEAADYLARLPPPAGPGIGAITFSGGLKGLLVEAAGRRGYRFPALAPETTAAFARVLGPDASPGNPLDSGFVGVTSQEAYLACIDIMLKDPAIDALMLQEELPRAPGSAAKESNLRAVQARVAAGRDKPVAFFSMVAHDLTEHSRALRRDLPDLPFLQDADTAFRTVHRIAAAPAPRAPAPAGDAAPPACLAPLRAAAQAGKRALSEPDAKALLRAYGIAVPAEALAASEDAAVDAATRLGFPVVLKVVSDDITHKSDVGGVVLGLADEAAVRAGWRRLHENLARNAPAAAVEGVLVARHVAGAIETVIGIQHDPEMGPVVMFGGGGVWIDLFGDVTFAAPPLDAGAARAMIDRTKAGRLLRGYRGGPVCDVDAAAAALVAAGRLAHEAGAWLESVDVNPLAVLPAGGGAIALDALVVPRPIPGEAS